LRLPAFPLGANQAHKVDRPGIVPRRTSRQLGKESTVIDVTRLTIQQIQEVFLQGFATSPRLSRECAAGGLRDAANLESNHEVHLATHRFRLTGVSDRRSSSN